jgi:hypothetical protein
MGNTISAANSTNASLDLANGNTKVKKDLEVVGISTFTGKSTFNGDLSVTNGKFNNIDVPTLSTDVNTLKTNVSSLQTTVTNVSTGSFTGKAISGATDVTASGTGQFNAVKTNNIDINGEFESTTGKKYITTSSTTGLFFTNGISDAAAKSSINLKTDGGIEITPATGKSLLVGRTATTGNLTVGNLFGGIADLVVTGKSTLSNLSVGGTTTLTGATTASGGITSSTLTVNGASTLTGATTATGAITANGGITSSALTVSGASTHTGTTTLTGATTATGAITANGGITSSTLTVSGASTHTGTTTLTGATTATGAITANGGITSSTLAVSGASTLSGDLNAKNVIIGTNKWLIEENVDANKGTRLCFGKVDPQATGGKKFYTCMNNDGNLETFQ